MENENKLLSVIIPMYNAERYIEECINSILNQTYEFLDIIIVDDGSTDNSKEICKKLLEKDNRLRLIEIENSGPYQARKAGANVARGDVLSFVDADDILELTTYSELMKIYGECSPDIIAFNYKYDNETIPKSYYSEGLYFKEDVLEKIIPGMMYDFKIGCRKLEPSIVSKIINKNLYFEITKQVKSRITLGEDALVTYPAICIAEKIYITNKAYYHYRNNLNSCTHIYPAERMLELKNFQEEINRLFENIGIRETMEFQVECYIRSFVSMMIRNWYGIERSSIMYSFPYYKLSKGINIAIYGAGDVGKSYINDIVIRQYANIVSWVDKNYNLKKTYNGYEISAPSDLLWKKYDKVLIAIYDEKIAIQVMQELLAMGIKKEKIIWEQPAMIG